MFYRTATSVVCLTRDFVQAGEATELSVPIRGAVVSTTFTTEWGETPRRPEGASNRCVMSLFQIHLTPTEFCASASERLRLIRTRIVRLQGIR